LAVSSHLGSIIHRNAPLGQMERWRFRYRTPTVFPIPNRPPRSRSHALTTMPIPGSSTVFRIPCPDRDSDIRLVHRVSNPMPRPRFRYTARPPRFRFHALTAVPIPGSSTVFRIPCPNGASHTSPGCKPWGAPRQHSSRSEGTPHSREPRTSTTPLPMRCSFRTH
jgi:hypothetical protein